MKTDSTHQVVIVADAHLPLDDRVGGEQQRNSFLNLLKVTAPAAACYILLGDIFDFWFEWKTVVPKRAIPILMQLRQTVDSGVPVHYFAGNHDFHLKGFLAREIGMQLHMNEWTSTIDDRKYYFHHGDGFAQSDSSYRSMKRIFRSMPAQWLFGNLIHPDVAMQMGRVTSSEGRKRYQNNQRTKPPLAEYLAAADRILAQGHDVVVFGHTHEAGDHQRPGGHYHNPGPFLEERRYSLIDGDLPRGEVFA